MSEEKYRAFLFKIASNGFIGFFEELDKDDVKRLCLEIEKYGAPRLSSDVAYFVPALPCSETFEERIILCTTSRCLTIAEDKHDPCREYKEKLEKIKELLGEERGPARELGRG